MPKQAATSDKAFERLERAFLGHRNPATRLLLGPGRALFQASYRDVTGAAPLFQMLHDLPAHWVNEAMRVDGTTAPPKHADLSTFAPKTRPKMPYIKHFEGPRGV